jgi:L-ascorbate metabolism protein UlaG (beta-lactamase superfamily)
MNKLKSQFGGKIDQNLLNDFSKSPYWKNGKFENLVETKMDISFATLPKLLYKQFFKTDNRIPQNKIPVANFDKASFLADAPEAKMIWYGHSVVLLRLNGKTILIDPMFGEDASPIAPFPTKRFSENTLAIIDALPEIDLVLLTHDHYDHLDYDSLLKLKAKTKEYFVALGVKRHLVSWGIDPNAVKEFDWWEKQEYNNIAITFTPTRHFSGRGLKDRAKSLWGGWVLKTSNENIWFSGDGGYGDHFKTIAEKLGPFDFAFMECGQYNENWHAIHMYPEESVQAALDGKVAIAMPVHWGGFSLAHHTWKEPVERFVAEAQKRELQVFIPHLGEMFSIINEKYVFWWEHFK